jgi:hypothetical protein
MWTVMAITSLISSPYILIGWNHHGQLKLVYSTTIYQMYKFEDTKDTKDTKEEMRSGTS